MLNDLDLTSAYERLIEGVLEAGVRIDAIGLQTHMHQGYRGESACGGRSTGWPATLVFTVGCPG